ncbi:esterase-like activity of phytase family protein [Actinosynnema sp. NPDC047251]|uniref:Phytase-like domain-containing protein n=1 Tax=Saccharothrix espanaensis (strain ATCC 51144 / DSM 44229 / JCM 9112 / NBRC 15066 / NRRL 15764) TaxID=1179773 RepID=K0KDT4_SACES|nr:esterase-like activity of phytase family protein [Saccharothrix espanaensis]CCH35727.1 hypothetical protein BN6_85130 [Saccharothrix espanaensis DSM 44229]
MLRTALVPALILALLPAQADAAPGVRFVAEHVLAPGTTVGGTTVGGLSGLDRDPWTGQYVLISDDRAAARFYTAKISARGVPTFTAVHRLRNAEGVPYPANTVDPEDVRVDPRTGHYLWVQEGERNGGTLIDPSVREATRDGGFVREHVLADNLKMRPDSGPRRNEALEGLALSHGRVITAVEGPLLQDGPPADHTRGAVSRLTVQTPDRVLAQYVYRQEPVFAPGGGTGVAAVLPHRDGLLVLERSFVPGVGNKVRLFEATAHGAANVKDKPLDGAKPMRKKLLADLADFPLSRVDNVEGMAWGPGGTLLLVSDDNFSPAQVTQFIVLALR